MIIDKQLLDSIQKSLIDYSKIKISECGFYDDEWFLDGSNRKIDFTIFRKRPDMENVIRNYIFFEFKTNSGSTVLRKYEGIKFFYRFVESEYPNVKKFEDVNKIIVNNYFHYTLGFKGTKQSTAYDENGTLLSRTSLTHNTLFIKRIFSEGYRSKWIDVPKEFPIQVEELYNSVICASPRMKIEKRTTKNEYKKETIQKIVTCAYEDEDLYLKTSLFVQTQCGLRLEEILSIKENAIRYFDGKPKLTYTTTKTEVGKVDVERPINELSAKIIEELTLFTAPIRKELKTPFIFVSMSNKRYGTPRNQNQVMQGIKYSYHFVDKSNFNRDFVNPFVARWDIREDGKPIELTTHYNRHFFAYLAWLENLSVESIVYMLNHKSFDMTNTYTYNLESQMREKFKQMMADPNNMVGVNVGSYKEKLAKKNVFLGKTEEQLNAIIGVMNVQILANGACMHHPLKADKVLEKCKPGCLKCDRFITHKCYLDVHRRRVERLEMVMESAVENKRQAWFEKCKAEKEFIEENFIKPF